ncbi:acyl-CoA dehydrogenase family protein [Actinocorallia aurea]
MYFGLSEEQAELSATVRALLERHADSAAVREAADGDLGHDPALWSLLCEQIGVAALAVPEQYGGAGFGYFETHVVLERLGYALAPTPLLGSGVLAVQALMRSGDATACARLLPALASGEWIGALAWATADGAWHLDDSDVLAETTWTGTTLSGTAHLVLDGSTADVLLVVARNAPGRVGLYEVDPSAPGIQRDPVPGMDGTLRFAQVRFDGARATTLALDARSLLAEVRDVAAVAVSALQVGAAQRGLDMTVRYAGERVQFGRPIGSFQALKHRMADMLVQVETARTLSWAAAWAVAQGDQDSAERAAAAKAWCSDALNEVAGETVQLHGGIAVTWEHDAQMLFKRAHALCQLFGGPDEQRRRYFDLLNLAGTPG